MNKFVIIFMCLFLFSFVSASIEYTPTSDTTCNGNVCTKTLYSGVRNVYEDNQWKSVENAKSLKDKGFSVVYLENDEEYPIEVIDFNYSSIKVKLNPKGIKVFDDNVPLKVWKQNSTKEMEFEQDVLDGKKQKKGKEKDYKEKMDKVKEEEISFNLLNQEEEMTLDFGLGNILEFGFNSTTVILQDNETDNMADLSTYYTGTGGGSGPLFIRFNISSIPSLSTIDNFSLNLFETDLACGDGGCGFDGTLKICNVRNQTWDEDTLVSQISNFATYNITDFSGVVNGSNVFQDINLTNSLQYELDNSNYFFTLRVEHDSYSCNPFSANTKYDTTTIHTGKIGEIDSAIYFASRENANVSARPSLNITYTAAAGDSVNPNITMNTPLNQTYNTNSINFNVTALDETAMDSCWYSLDAGTTNITMLNTTSLSDYNSTNASMTQGSHTANFYCNDSANNINNTESVTFFIDSIFPLISIATPANNTFTTNTGLNVNYTASDTNLDSCWYSNDSMSLNTTQAGCINITTITWSEGQHNVTIWVNDSANNVNSSSVTFTIDTLFSNISFEDSSDSGTVNVDNIFMNVSSTDANSISVFIDDGSLVSWWRMDDVNSSGDPTDYFGINNGSANGDAVQVVDGKLGKGFEFDGTGDYIKTPVNSELNLNGKSITLSSWVKINKFKNEYDGIIAYGSGGSWYTLYINNVNKTHMRINGGYVNGNKVLNEGEWYHILGVFDNDTGTISIYVNGVLDISQSGKSWGASISDTSLYIGSNSVGTGEYINATIDDVMIFNRTLTTDEILGLYANTTSKYLEVNFTNLIDGDHSFIAYSQDIAGNINFTDSRSVTIQLDTTPPTINITFPLNASSHSFPGQINLTLNVSSTDSSGISSMWYTLDLGGTNTSFINTTGIALSQLNGETKSYTIKVYVNDTLNNINSSSAYITISQTASPGTGGGGGTTSYYSYETGPCDLIYEFILDHYDNISLEYLTYEFEDLKIETNLTTEELKDYLINYETLCEEELPFEAYNAIQEIIRKSTLKESIYQRIKSIFSSQKYFLITVSLFLVSLIIYKNRKSLKLKWG